MNDRNTLKRTNADPHTSWQPTEAGAIRGTNPVAASASGHHRRNAELVGATRQIDALKTWSLPRGKK
jgi:hypothetical protein